MFKKLTLEEFIEKANEVHNSKYIYSKFSYINSKTKSIIMCTQHGEFLQSPNSHLQCGGCPKCGNEILKNKRSLGKEEFIRRSHEIHNHKYNYNKVVYNTGGKIKIIITCPVHGDFSQLIGTHLGGRGCRKCGNESEKHFYNKEEFIKRASEIHNSKYDYSKFIYINCFEHGIIICPNHGEFLQRVNRHLQGRGCPTCGKEKFKDSINSFTEKANKAHNNKYDYSKFVYTGSKNKSIIICPKHGEFLQEPAGHIRGNGCRKCGDEKTGDKNRLGLEEFVKRSNKIHDNKYDYSKFVYISVSSKGIIICPIHGEFIQYTLTHLAGGGCPSCANIYSKKCNLWICSFNNPNIIMSYKTKVNNRRFEFDGFNPITNTIYEFYGNLFHGNPRIFNSNGINPLNKRTFGELYQHTIEREEFLDNLGFKLITIWEDEWDQKIKDIKNE